MSFGMDEILISSVTINRMQDVESLDNFSFVKDSKIY